jgi:protein required for attachment to host cells
MQLQRDTTVVVTDGEKLRLFRNTGTELQLALAELPRPEVHGDSEESGHQQRAGQDARDHQEASFSAAVARWLNHEVATGRINLLLVIAPPRALGQLRQHCGNEVKKRLVGELPKEHTHDAVHVLEQVVTDA